MKNRKIEEGIPAFGNLEGLTVVYSAIEIAAPTAAQLMAEWGANVIWIENVHTGDSMRDTAYIKEIERRNQRSVALNPFKPEGREVLLKLIEQADIFIESSKGPVYKERGITDELLWEHNPELVITHISGFGQYGDETRIKRAAYDLTVQAYTGYAAQNGTPEQPMIAAPYTGDYFSALMAVSSTLAALYKAKQTGKGESIDLAMYETMLRVGAYYMVDYLNAGTLYPRPGAEHQNLCAIGVYNCLDGSIGLECYGVSQNKYLLETIGLGELWGTEEYPEDTSGLWLDSPKAQLIQDTLRTYLTTQKMADVIESFGANRIAVEQILEIPDLPKQEHYALREDFIEWENNQGKTIKGIGIFPKFVKNPGKVWRPMPDLGQDTENVLKAVGYTDEELQKLEGEGIIKTQK